MKKFISKALLTVAVLASGALSMGCIIMLADEPTAPKSMID